MVVHVCNPSTEEIEAEGSGVQGHPPVHNELETSLYYMRLWRKRKKGGGEVSCIIKMIYIGQEKSCRIFGWHYWAGRMSVIFLLVRAPFISMLLPALGYHTQGEHPP